MIWVYINELITNLNVFLDTGKEQRTVFRHES